MDNPLTRLPSAQQDITPANEETCIAYAYFSSMIGNNTLTKKDPLSLKEAQDMPDWESWDEAIHEELNQLHDMGTWKLVDLPEGREAIRSKWVFT